MWNEILNIAISNGIFAALFVALLVYELKDSRTREKKYQKTIDSLSNKIGIIQDVKQDVEEIKNIIIFPKKGSDNNGKIQKIDI